MVLPLVYYYLNDHFRGPNGHFYSKKIGQSLENLRVTCDNWELYVKWILVHKKVKGNETADLAAKTARQRTDKNTRNRYKRSAFQPTNFTTASAIQMVHNQRI